MPGKLTTHVLNVSTGQPAEGVRIDLFRIEPDPGRIRSMVTNRDGRTDAPLLGSEELVAGTYQLEFHVGAYFGSKAAGEKPPFLSVVPVRIGIADAGASYHVPLLVSPWAYSTYRGS